VELLMQIMIQRVPFWRHVVDSAASNRVRSKSVLGPGTSQRESTIVCTNLRPMRRNRHSGDIRKPWTPEWKQEKGEEREPDSGSRRKKRSEPNRTRENQEEKGGEV
jgi:hypothetical protein